MRGYDEAAETDAVLSSEVEDTDVAGTLTEALTPYAEGFYRVSGQSRIDWLHNGRDYCWVLDGGELDAIGRRSPTPSSRTNAVDPGKAWTRYDDRRDVGYGPGGTRCAYPPGMYKLDGAGAPDVYRIEEGTAIIDGKKGTSMPC